MFRFEHEACLVEWVSSPAPLDLYLWLHAMAVACLILTVVCPPADNSNLIETALKDMAAWKGFARLREEILSGCLSPKGQACKYPSDVAEDMKLRKSLRCSLS